MRHGNESGRVVSHIEREKRHQVKTRTLGVYTSLVGHARINDGPEKRIYWQLTVCDLRVLPRRVAPDRTARTDPTYLKLFFESRLARVQVDRVSVSSVVTTFNVKDLKCLQVPMVSLGEQEDIARRYESLAAEVTVYRRRIEKVRAKMTELFSGGGEAYYPPSTRASSSTLRKASSTACGSCSRSECVNLQSTLVGSCPSRTTTTVQRTACCEHSYQTKGTSRHRTRSRYSE